MALLALLTLVGLTLASAASSKRGLVFVNNPKTAQDNKIWTQHGSDLTWYYNYGATPSPVYASIPQSQFEFVPMMWGVGADLNDTTFLGQVKDQISRGVAIRHVLGFNEPDGPPEQGGSNIAPAAAAQAWVANFEPLGRMGVKLGLPACTGSPAGIPWLKQFLGNCSAILSAAGPKQNCTWDFLPVHWYDNFAGLASMIGERQATWPGAEVWVTEYAFAHQDLQTTQEYFNQTLDYFDKQDPITHYSWFGGFRSNVANVGPNAAFLDAKGRLTDIGSWYLGFGATGVEPTSAASVVVPGRAAAAAGVVALAFLCGVF
ncbi:Alkali-sensitive linkage protein 1 [Escovopsis weberi]|uniref:Alkali-sensitive linkage protein 1 n=1 Tax=Escovopsis weberi TaxID=150374 RepID=A0A0M8MYL3_ESCWE|nr:Alkali-sensitive linkage protein 1 [Escovopsis weberi]